MTVAWDEPMLTADEVARPKLKPGRARQKHHVGPVLVLAAALAGAALVVVPRGIEAEALLAAKVAAAVEEAASASAAAESFARGLITGEPDNMVGLAGTTLGDLFVFGDIRDAVREGSRLAAGEQADELILGLACVGLVITAGTYATVGVAAPARVGMTVLKAARKTGRIGSQMAAWIGRSAREVVDWTTLRRAVGGASVTAPAVAVRAAREAVKVEKAKELVHLVGDVGRVQAKAGTRAAHRLPCPPPLRPRDMQRFGHDGVEIAFLDEGEGEPIVLVHGFASTAQVNWVHPGWVTTLTRAGRRVIALDNRGHGASSKLYDPAAYHSARMADDVRALLDHLGINRADVMGYSMGARITAFFALAHPARLRRAVLGGLGVRLVDGVGLPESIADALEAPTLSDVGDPTGRTFRAFAEQTRSDLTALAACIRGSRQTLTRDQ